MLGTGIGGISMFLSDILLQSKAWIRWNEVKATTNQLSDFRANSPFTRTFNRNTQLSGSRNRFSIINVPKQTNSIYSTLEQIKRKRWIQSEASPTPLFAGSNKTMSTYEIAIDEDKNLDFLNLKKTDQAAR